LEPIVVGVPAWMITKVVCRHTCAASPVLLLSTRAGRSAGSTSAGWAFYAGVTTEVLFPSRRSGRLHRLGRRRYRRCCGLTIITTTHLLHFLHLLDHIVVVALGSSLSLRSYPLRWPPGPAPSAPPSAAKACTDSGACRDAWRPVVPGEPAPPAAPSAPAPPRVLYFFHHDA
jgi:hypothetical protein